MIQTKNLFAGAVFAVGMTFFSCFGAWRATQVYASVRHVTNITKNSLNDVSKGSYKDNNLLSPYYMNVDGRTVMHVACERHDFVVAKFFLDVSSDLQAKMMLTKVVPNTHIPGGTPLMLAILSKEKHYDPQAIIQFMEYIKQRFGADFAKELIVQQDTDGLSARDHAKESPYSHVLERYFSNFLYNHN